MRLIDADAFLKTENERCNGEPIIGTCTGNNEYLRHRIESQPTAYDVDKVVEQLKSIASHAIYIELYYMYCDNCRFRSEIGEEESRNQFGYWACEDCYRKYNGWAISKEVADRIADNIVEEMRNEANEQTNNQN